ncbi:MAG TPA: DUF11 domain-containing protein, partial [Pyrinomonadaceae bacterium]|nr:DUF11 domain-containing protein [Pyrinomonadaceae bacterium]
MALGAIVLSVSSVSVHSSSTKDAAKSGDSRAQQKDGGAQTGGRDAREASTAKPSSAVSVQNQAVAGPPSRGSAKSSRPLMNHMLARFFPTLANTTVTATKKDALLVDLNNDGVANPGDTLRYTVTITNTGGMDATGLTFNDTPDNNTTVVPGSVKTTPIAGDDTYSALG